MSPSLPSSAEQLSALADGQGRDLDLARVLAACGQDVQLQQRWRDYHLIGEVLRGQLPGAPVDEVAFLARLRTSLQASALRQESVTGTAANEPRFGWPQWATAATVVLAAGVLWALDGWVRDAPELAQARPVLRASAEGPIERDAALQELLETHRQQGGASVLPMPSGFLRNATFDVEPAILAAPRAGR